jgi:glycosyltransferase involved in cell wall biosynthesis
VSPTFSVCIVVRDRTQLVITAMRSVLASNYSRFELVVVDDGSTIALSDALRTTELPQDPRVRVIRQAPAGIGRARNVALHAASGEFVTVLDSDDELLPDGLTRLAQLIERKPCDWVYTDYEEVRRGVRTTIRLPAYASPESMLLAVLMRPRLPFKHSGTTIRRELLLALGGYDEALRIKVDVELMLRALRQGVQPVHLAEPVVLFRHHGSNLSRRRMQGIRTWLELIDVYAPRRPGVRTVAKAVRVGSELGKWLVSIGTS